MQYKPDYNFVVKAGELTGNGVIVYNIKTKKFEYVNQNFLKMFETTEEALKSDGGFILQFIHAEDLGYLKKKYEELFSRGFIESTEFRLHLPGNKIRHISAYMVMLENDNLISSIISDISQTKVHEDYLINYSARKDTMLDMLTHNLSGPLQLSKEIIASIRQGISQNKFADLSRLITIMQENTQQCIDIVDDFLREEHFESVQIYVKKARFDVIEKLNVIIGKMRELNKDKTFMLSSSSQFMHINSDPVKFYQVMHNLLSNAIKFTPEGATIEVTVTEKDSNLQITVKDYGIGMPKAIQGLIFHGKVQGRTGLKGEKSLGMGLAITKQLVELMGGEIGFESAEGEGSSFFVLIPKD